MLHSDVNSVLVSSSGKAIPGNLRGNYLLDCFAFGRVAGLHAVKYMTGGQIQETSLAELSGADIGATAIVSPSLLSIGELILKHVKGLVTWSVC